MCYNIVFKGESMQITIVDVSGLNSLVSAAGKPYKALEVAYKNEQGQIASKKIMEFDKVLLKPFQSFKKGDVVDVLSVKEGDYWQWKSATLAVSGGAAVQEAPKYAGASATPSIATKSTYETSEERAAKQVYIIRQSSISTAVNLLGTGAKTPANLSLVLDTAKAFEDYVLGNKAVAPKMPGTAGDFLDDFDDDIPL